MELRPVLLTLFLCALWGGLGPSIKLSLQGMPPVALAGWRFLTGLLCLLVWCRVNRLTWWLPKRHHKALVGFALIFVTQISLLNLGTSLTSSNHSVVFLSTNPVFVALIAHFLIPNDRLYSLRVRGKGGFPPVPSIHSWKVGGLLLAFAGICVIFLDGGHVPAGNPLVGDLLVLSSGFLLGVIQVYSKFLVRDLNAYQVIVWELVYGVPLYFALSFLFERNAVYHLTPAVIGGVLYQGIVIAAFSFVTWTRLLQRFSASKMSAFQFTTPVFGVIISWLVLGDSVSSGFAMGVGLVAAGIYLVSKANGERKPL